MMSADITPDHRKVALATNTKKVKCYDTASGELLYTIAKHTEWVTGADFSPDGILLATADRNGNVMVWEADNGGEFYNLGQHKGAVTDLAWRADSNVLASCGADGTITTWEMKTGKRVANWSAHGAVQSVAFTPDGRPAFLRQRRHQRPLGHRRQAPPPGPGRQAGRRGLQGDGPRRRQDLRHRQLARGGPFPRTSRPVAT